MDIFKLIGAIMLLGGSLSLLVAAIGMLKMPDVYNRVQVATKASTFGAIFSFLGLAIIKFEHWFTGENWLGRVIILIIFIYITNPVSSHVLMRAAYFMRFPLSKLTKTDVLRDDTNSNLLKEPKNE
jgi:multicomponent Na+:H+ antiporter subunit G